MTSHDGTVVELLHCSAVSSGAVQTPPSWLTRQRSAGCSCGLERAWCEPVGQKVRGRSNIFHVCHASALKSPGVIRGQNWVRLLEQVFMGSERKVQLEAMTFGYETTHLLQDPGLLALLHTFDGIVGNRALRTGGHAKVVLRLVDQLTDIAVDTDGSCEDAGCICRCSCNKRLPWSTAHSPSVCPCNRSSTCPCQSSHKCGTDS